MNILVINAGSSSVKFTLYGMADETVLASGMVERIGLSGTRLTYHNLRGDQIEKAVQVSDARQAVAEIAAALCDGKSGVIESFRDITAVGHRVVHGGEKMTQPVIVDDGVKKIINECFDLAPLHNPPNLTGIKACQEQFPGVPQVAVFDTAFHATLPEQAYLYGLPYRLYKEDKIRRYGFHGISHKYVSQEAARFLKRPLIQLKIITCHIGNGVSITAVNGGQSVDTSMGLTPLEGTIMGTRCGDLDPAIVFYLMEHKQLNHQQINELLNKQSGLLGLAGIGSSDLRDIIAAGQKGNHRADTAIKVFAYRIKKYIGAYTAAMGGVDVIVFTAGVGENSVLIRQLVCTGLNGLGIILDSHKNSAGNGRLSEIQHDASQVKILIVPTNEEKEIAHETVQLMQTV